MSIATIIRADHATLHDRADQWKYVRDCMEGEFRIKKKGVTYLPRPSAMLAEEGDADPYTAYVKRAQFYNVVARTVRGLVGMVFRIEPTFKVPEVLEERIQALTPGGATIWTYARRVTRELLSIGRHGILLDLPRDADHSGVPHMAPFDAEDILYWEERVEDGRRHVVLVDLREGIERTPIEKDGKTVEEDQDKVLQLAINTEGFYEQRRFLRAPGTYGTPAGAVIEDVQIRGAQLTEIPFHFVNPFDLDPAVEVPPSFDLVVTNLAHYRNSADYEHSLFLTAMPTPGFSGVSEEEEDKIGALGPGALICLRAPEAKGWMLEFQGAGIDAIRQAMIDKEQRMAALGARMIREQKRAAETAEKARLDAQDETSLAISIIRTIEDAFTKVLKQMAEWAAADLDEVEVNFNKEFIELRMSPQELTAHVAAWQQGAFSEDVLWSNLQRGKVAPATRTLEEDREIREEENQGTRFRPGMAPEDEIDDEDEGEDAEEAPAEEAA